MFVGIPGRVIKKKRGGKLGGFGSELIGVSAGNNIVATGSSGSLTATFAIGKIWLK
jgi:hypothetical protein